MMDFLLDTESDSLLQSMTEILDQAFQSEYFGLCKKKMTKGKVDDGREGLKHVRFSDNAWKENCYCSKTGEILSGYSTRRVAIVDFRNCFHLEIFLRPGGGEGF